MGDVYLNDYLKFVWSILFLFEQISMYRETQVFLANHKF